MKKIIYSDSFIEFLRQSNCKVGNILYRLHYKNYTPKMVTSEEVNYLTFRQDGTISFLPAGKDHIVNDDNTWKREGRQHGKPGRVIKKLFAPRVQRFFKDSDFECFSNAYKANFNDDGYSFVLRENKDIPEVYCMSRMSGEGSLNNSCMNDDRGYLDLYKHCQQLSILTLINKDGLLCGRALIWKISDDITLMDRIYVVQDYMYDKFLTYCEDKKWWRKSHYKTYDYKTMFITPEGKEVDKRFDIETPTDFDEYPYIDTFQYGDDGTLSNHSGEYTYNETDGTRDGDDREDDHEGQQYDEINECWINEDDAVYIENGDRNYRDRTCDIEDCICVNDDWYYKEDSHIVEVGNKWYLKDSEDLCIVNDEYELRDDCTYCERDDEYYLSDDCVYCEDDEEDVLRDEAIEIDDKWYHKESDKIVKIDGTWYTKDSDDLVEIEGELYVKDSDQIVEIEDEFYLKTSPLIVELNGVWQQKQLSIQFEDENNIKIAS